MTRGIPAAASRIESGGRVVTLTHFCRRPFAHSHVFCARGLTVRCCPSVRDGIISGCAMRKACRGPRIQAGRAGPGDCGAVIGTCRLRVLQAPQIVLLLLAKPDWRFGEGVFPKAMIRICVLRKRDGMLGLGCFFEVLLGAWNGTDAQPSGPAPFYFRMEIGANRRTQPLMIRVVDAFCKRFVVGEIDISPYPSLNVQSGGPGAGLR